MALIPTSLSAANLLTINPGGGQQNNGSDGILIMVNDGLTDAGDQVRWKSKTQYFCCDNFAKLFPVLSVGNVGYGKTSTYSAERWDSISISNLTGSAVLCPFVGSPCPGTAGSGSATITYTKTISGQPYILIRTITYVYPRARFTDTYTVQIPDDGAGNAVKLYYGGTCSRQGRIAE